MISKNIYCIVFVFSFCDRSKTIMPLTKPIIIGVTANLCKEVTAITTDDSADIKPKMMNNFLILYFLKL